MKIRPARVHESGSGRPAGSSRRTAQAVLALWLACAALPRPTPAQPLVLDSENRQGCPAFQYEGRSTIMKMRPESCLHLACVNCVEPHAYEQANMPACAARVNTGGFSVQPRKFALVMDKAAFLCAAGETSPYDSESRSVAWRPTFDAARCCWQRAASAPPCSRAFSALVSLATDTTGWLLHHCNGWMWVAPSFLSQGVPHDYCWRLPGRRALEPRLAATGSRR